MKSELDKHNTIYSAFAEQVAKSPDKIAVVFEDMAIGYADLNQKVLKLCEHLKSRGIQSGDAIAVVLPNCYEYTVILLAASKLKLLLVPFNTGLPIHSILSNYKSLNIQYSFVWFGLTHKILEIDNSLRNSILNVGGDNTQSDIHFDDIESIVPDKNPQRQTDDDQDAPFIICMTSGSTGNPKPILLNQKTKLMRIKALEENYHINNEDITLAATPLYHSLAMRLVLQPLVMGGTSIILNGFSVIKWVAAITDKHISFTIAVSSQLKQIAEFLKSNKKQFQSLRVLVSSSEQLSLDTKQLLVKTLGCEFHECYGTSEIGIASNLQMHDEIKIKSVGKAIKDVDIVILDENRKLLGANIIGEIACKTPMRFTEYLHQTNTTARAFHHDYFLTGDLGCLDEEGFLYYKGRKKELIISGGINIYPKDIEDVIKQVSGVKEVAVVPQPDPNLGEVVRAIIVKEQDTELSLRKIKLHCAENLADFQFPRAFHFIDELPKNSLGKLQKHKLFAREESEMAAIA